VTGGEEGAQVSEHSATIIANKARERRERASVKPNAMADMNEKGRYGWSRFSSATALAYSMKVLGQVSTASFSDAAASAELPFMICHWPM